MASEGGATVGPRLVGRGRVLRFRRGCLVGAGRAGLGPERLLVLVDAAATRRWRQLSARRRRRCPRADVRPLLLEPSREADDRVPDRAELAGDPGSLLEHRVAALLGFPGLFRRPLDDPG